MNGLDLLAFLCPLLCLYALWLRRTPGRANAFWPRAGLVALYVLVLVIGARFGARTYPGIWFPYIGLINAFTQGGMFYVAAAFALIAGGLDLWLTANPSPHLDKPRLFDRRLRQLVTWLLAIAVIIDLFGLLMAVLLQRLFYW